MRRTAVLGRAPVAAFVAFATPALAQSFVGDWTATAHLDGAEVSEGFRVTKAGDGYAITAKPPIDAPADAPQAGPGKNIVLDGDKFSYRRSLTLPDGGAVNITYAGVVSGDTFTGTAEVGGSPVSYTGVRVRTGG